MEELFAKFVVSLAASIVAKEHPDWVLRYEDEMPIFDLCGVRALFSMSLALADKLCKSE